MNQSNPQPILEMRNISKRFGGVTALNAVSLAAYPGEVLALCGENGAGKSTLMKILSGCLHADDGEILLRGEKANFTGPRDAELRGVSIIHQELNLVPDLSAAANIFLGRERTKFGFLLDNRQMEAEAKKYFDQLGASFAPSTKVRDLRIGDQQLVEIAKALSLQAEILIMDEPTSALTGGEVERLFRIIEELKARNVAIIYISHKMDEVFRLANRVSVLRDGQHVRTELARNASPGDVIKWMVGREIEYASNRTESKPGEVILEVSKLSLPHRDRAGDFHLQEVSFQLRAGEILGIGGLLGAGRTELLECLFGASHRLPMGNINFQGKSVTIKSPRDAMDLGIALVTEDRKNLGIFDQWSVGNNITLCKLDDLSSAKMLMPAKEREAGQKSVQRLSIKTDGLAASILSLSGGNQQKCILARWLLTDPKVLLLDEPTRGIDIGAKSDLHDLMRQLAREGLAIIMTSSELPELIAVADRIIVLSEGRLTGEFEGKSATEENIMQAATAFRSKVAATA